MSYSTITWAGVSSDTIGCNLKIERYPDLNRPRRKMDVYSVPGRNGDLILPQDAWENYTQKYEIYAGDGVRGASPEAFVAVAAWLYGPSGYQKLIDSYEPEYYRLAYYEGGLDVANSLSRFGKATIEFNCRPERFLITGERELVLEEDLYQSNNLKLTNPTSFPSKPIFRIVCGRGAQYDTDAAVFIGPTAYISGAVFRINLDSSLAGQTIYVDAQGLNCYDASGNNLNKYVSFRDGFNTTYAFPEIPTGMSYLGSLLADDEPNSMITEVGITPNWWTL